MNEIFSWQVAQLERLRGHLIEQDLAHAYLIDDPAGEGSQGFVRALASTILCDQTQLGGCSNCSSCKLQSAGSHSDLLWVSPEDSKQIKIEQIRSVIEWSHQTPQQGRAKVLVLDPADRMNIYAANSLLKLLEEPAPKTYLFLISTSPARLDIPADCAIDALLDGRETDQIYANNVLLMVQVLYGWLWVG